MPSPTQILSTGAKVELAFAVVIVAFFLRFQDDLGDWLTPRVLPIQTSAPGHCREPGEHEQLLVPHVLRDGRLVPDGCLYVASQSAYPKKPRPKVADARPHD